MEPIDLLFLLGVLSNLTPSSGCFNSECSTKDFLSDGIIEDLTGLLPDLIVAVRERLSFILDGICLRFIFIDLLELPFNELSRICSDLNGVILLSDSIGEVFISPGSSRVVLADCLQISSG
eukprot:NODE_155_length_16773_cov_0.488785.p12 type:complete len:121 gc:universal NODE_155_length_16773_cov_0.488785:14052-13690(-)